MRLLLTRPRADAEALAEILQDFGHDSLIEPLLTIEIYQNQAIDLLDVAALIVTSANGIRAFTQNCEVRSIPVLAVGEATARAAQELGFENIDSAHGDVDDLVRLITSKQPVDDKILLHIAGTKVAGDLAGQLSALGYVLRRQVLYEARASESLSLTTRTAISNGNIDAVVIFSPRTAKTFVRLVLREQLQDKVSNVTVFCLSDAVAQATSRLNWARVCIAAEPSQTAILAQIGQA